MAGCTPSKLRGHPPQPKEQPQKPNESEESPKEPVRQTKFPHKFHDILKEAENPDMDSLDGQIFSGVFLSNKTKKYWVEKETMHNCFMILARGLSIAWVEDPIHWNWIRIRETSQVEIEVALLLNVCWLEIHGKLETSFLTPGIMYEVAFVVMTTPGIIKWSSPVNLKLKLPDGNVHEHQESLQEKPREQWTDLRVGEFTANAYQAGDIEISLFEYGGQWKQGLVVKGAIIRPKK